MPARLLARGGRSTFDLDLDDDEPLLLQLEQLHEAVLGNLVLDETEDARRRADGLRDAEQVEVLLVARVVDARDRLPYAVRLLRDLRDHEVVLVVSGHSEQQLRRTRDPGALEDGDLGRVAADHRRAELLLEPREPVRRAARRASPRGRGRASVRVDVRADLPSPCDDDVHQPVAALGVAARTVSSSDEIAVCVGQTMLIPRSE